MPRILVVEDDLKIIKAIEKTLSLGRAFSMRAVSEPARVLPEVFKYKPDLILLDVRLPGGDGREILKNLKDNVAARSIPVIFLTGMAGEGDKVIGLNLGADDYVVKPFGARELLARINAVFRRTMEKIENSKVSDQGGLKLNPGNREARLDGQLLDLQPKEFEILCLLASHPGKALSRSYLIENSSSYGIEVSTRSLDTHIKNIRKKFGRKSSFIQTVPKLGYRFAPVDG